MSGVLAMILAGGEENACVPWLRSAQTRCPVWGNYRIIDFALSNFINSGFLKIFVPPNLNLIHWCSISGKAGGYPDSGGIHRSDTGANADGKTLVGHCDAIYQNMNLIKDTDPEHVCIFGGDHIYRMDISQMLRFLKKGMPSDRGDSGPGLEAKHFGIIEVDKTVYDRFCESPKAVLGRCPVNRIWCWLEGNYIFNRHPLEDMLQQDSQMDNQSWFWRDDSENVLRKVYVYDFSQNHIPDAQPKEAGWRDAGTIRSYWKRIWIWLVLSHSSISTTSSGLSWLTILLSSCKVCSFQWSQDGSCDKLWSLQAPSSAVPGKIIVGYNTRVPVFPMSMNRWWWTM